MEKRENDLLLEQVKCMILNREISPSLYLEGEDWAKLQEAILYLSKCVLDANDFVRQLSKGNMNIQTPDRYNFLSGYLKELHSSLQYLTWQAGQIAKGDYTQRVHFLGEFSLAFNTMVEQLSEREAKLKEQSLVMQKNISQMKSIMDSVNDWIIVTSHQAGDILYCNQAAQDYFLEDSTYSACKPEYRELFDYMRKHCPEGDGKDVFEFVCQEKGSIYQIKSATVYWDNEYASVHFVQDITGYRKAQSELETMSYRDELTGLYNRRYCIMQMEKLMEEKHSFALCLMDLDGLKFANDHFGHKEGDAYLILFTDELRKISRQSDILCRVGGDEFVALFPDCSTEILTNRLEQINLRLKERENRYPMSVSYGFVEILQDSTLSIEDIITLSDQRMYAMKLRRHKNRAT